MISKIIYTEGSIVPWGDIAGCITPPPLSPNPGLVKQLYLHVSGTRSTSMIAETCLNSLGLEIVNRGLCCLGVPRNVPKNVPGTITHSDLKHIKQSIRNKNEKVFNEYLKK